MKVGHSFFCNPVAEKWKEIFVYYFETMIISYIRGLDYSVEIQLPPEE